MDPNATLSTNCNLPQNGDILDEEVNLYRTTDNVNSHRLYAMRFDHNYAAVQAPTEAENNSFISKQTSQIQGDYASVAINNDSQAATSDIDSGEETETASESMEYNDELNRDLVHDDGNYNENINGPDVKVTPKKNRLQNRKIHGELKHGMVLRKPKKTIVRKSQINKTGGTLSADKIVGKKTKETTKEKS
ncbi:uncharacterized protein LOC119683175 [Teleopsis dalmanni]|uniref:uncharacterized protein LOC119683175 n=1 Tax=Teleopsis dalmanni TaxID=139649 RepID=UPI0018CE2385|nr:uncharacterized protein LOC119683175 [Teleopsis dalmanni]